jgi:hypothetical protein
LSVSENLGEGRPLPKKKKWRDDFLSNEIPISPSSPLSKCSPSPMKSFGVESEKLRGETDNFQSGPSNVTMPSNERPLKQG